MIVLIPITLIYVYLCICSLNPQELHQRFRWCSRFDYAKKRMWRKACFFSSFIPLSFVTLKAIGHGSYFTFKATKPTKQNKNESPQRMPSLYNIFTLCKYASLNKYYTSHFWKSTVKRFDNTTIFIPCNKMWIKIRVSLV